MKLLINYFIFLLISFDLFALPRLYLGPDAFYRSFREIIVPEGKSEERGWLFGFQAGLDFSRLWQPYAKVHLRWAEGTSQFDGTVHNQILNKFAAFASHTKNTYFEAKTEIGYLLGSETSQICPFGALGWQGWMREAKNRAFGYDEWEHWCYLGLGVRSRWNVSSHWSLELAFESMRTKLADIQIRGLYSWPIILSLENTWQMEAEFPIRYKKSSYEISWVGYFRYLPIGKSETQRTSRGEIFVPQSIMHIWGNRLEFSYLF